MDYLHNSFVGSHGHLTSKTCIVDARYSCKITDYGVNWLRNRYADPETDEEDADGKHSYTVYFYPMLLRTAIFDFLYLLLAEKIYFLMNIYTFTNFNEL